MAAVTPFTVLFGQPPSAFVSVPALKLSVPPPTKLIVTLLPLPPEFPADHQNPMYLCVVFKVKVVSAAVAKLPAPPAPPYWLKVLTVKCVPLPEVLAKVPNARTKLPV